MKTALIFGAAGFVGRYLAEELSSHGYRVVGSDVINPVIEHAEAGGCPEIGNAGVGGHSETRSIEIGDTRGAESGFSAFAVCDLLDAAGILRVVEQYRPTAIINLAAVSSVGQTWKIPQKTMEVNVNGALNILEAARSFAPEASILFVGSSEEYAVSEEPISESTPLNANNPYGISKVAMEQFSEIYRNRYGMKIHSVRSFNHTGVGQKPNFVIPSWCRQAAEITKSGRSGVMKVGNTSVIRDFGNVKDMARAYRLVLESEDCSVIYNIGTGKGILLSDLLEYIVSLSPQEITVEQDPELFRPSDNPVIVCDHSLITQRLGWMPEHSIYDTVKEMYEAFLREG